MHDRFDGLTHRAGTRVAALFVVLLITGIPVGIFGSWVYAPAVGWMAGGAVYVGWTWMMIGKMDPGVTAAHATREDPTRAVADILLIASSLASFGAILLLLVDSGNAQGPAKIGLGAASLGTIAVSWLLVHTLFTLRYAAVFYRDGGHGIDFNQSVPPQYSDFAYVAFTLGMTYQVSDTDFTSHGIRVIALRHGLLSFLLGVVVLAATINLIVGLAR